MPKAPPNPIETLIDKAGSKSSDISPHELCNAFTALGKLLVRQPGLGRKSANIIHSTSGGIEIVEILPNTTTGSRVRTGQVSLHFENDPYQPIAQSLRFDTLGTPSIRRAIFSDYKRDDMDRVIPGDVQLLRCVDPNNRELGSFLIASNIALGLISQ